MLLGLDNAGKTTLLKSLASEDVNTITPTQVRGRGWGSFKRGRKEKKKEMWDDLACHGHVVCTCSLSHFLFLFRLSFSSPLTDNRGELEKTGCSRLLEPFHSFVRVFPCV